MPTPTAAPTRSGAPLSPTLTYPSDRVVGYDYGPGGLDDALGRISAIAERGAGTDLARFAYLGLDTCGRVAYPQPGMALSLVRRPDEPLGDGGDRYVGLDRFGRLVDQRWQNSAAADLDRVQYGYDRAANRRWRRHPIAGAADEFYVYDGFYQLIQRQRGTLDAGQTGLAGAPAAEEEFAYDPSGNWSHYRTKAAGSITLDQERAHNAANGLTALENSTALLNYDLADNLTLGPQPGSWTAGWQFT